MDEVRNTTSLPLSVYQTAMCFWMFRNSAGSPLGRTATQQKCKHFQQMPLKGNAMRSAQQRNVVRNGSRKRGPNQSKNIMTTAEKTYPQSCVSWTSTTQT